MEMTTVILGLILLGFFAFVAMVFYPIYREQKREIKTHSEAIYALNGQVVRLKRQEELDCLTIEGLQNQLQNQLQKQSQAYIDLHQDFDDRLEAAVTQWQKIEAPLVRAAALAKQKQVRTGFTSEAFAPFAIPGFAAEDYFRIGGSIDYLVLDGADAVRDRRANEVDQVLLLDIKTGKADLNTVQRRIRDAVVAGRVAFATYNMDTEVMRTWEQDKKQPIQTP